MKHYMVGSVVAGTVVGERVFGLKRAARQAKSIDGIKKADGSGLCDAATAVARRVLGNRS